MSTSWRPSLSAPPTTIGTLPGRSMIVTGPFVTDLSGELLEWENQITNPISIPGHIAHIGHRSLSHGQTSCSRHWSIDVFTERLVDAIDGRQLFRCFRDK
jgi:hypothetical protein